MAVPKKRTSKAKRNMRRAHDAITAPNIVVEADGTVRNWWNYNRSWIITGV